MSHRVFSRIHHLSFVVADLDRALTRLGALAKYSEIIREELPQRGVATLRFRVGDHWIVLVCPVGPGVPATRLAEHGDGPFLVSYAVESIAEALDGLARDGIEPSGPTRDGLAGWRVQDLALELPGGIAVQLCEDPDGDGTCRG
jgi:methylmalonyl-CoA/ethylmalonyl-CoA epimerase